MKNATRILALLLVLGLMSFKGHKAAKDITFKTGIYGSCMCAASELNDNQKGVKLTLNDDHTFTYFDNTYYKRVLDLKGTWTQDGKTIKLIGHNSPYKIHDTWKVDSDNGNCIKSRKGMEWRRLCFVKGCK
jgi:hypothetical protein